MMKKVLILLLTAACLCSVSAASNWLGVESELWDEPNNWDVKPDITKDAWVGDPTAAYPNCLAGTDVNGLPIDHECFYLAITSGTLTLNEGSLSSAAGRQFFLANPATPPADYTTPTLIAKGTSHTVAELGIWIENYDGLVYFEENATHTANSRWLLGLNATGDGKVYVRDNAQVTINSFAHVGSAGLGELHCEGDSTTTFTGTIAVGNGPTGSGKLFVQDNATLQSNVHVSIGGNAGYGELHVTGGLFKCTRFIVGIPWNTAANSQGHAYISGGKVECDGIACNERSSISVSGTGVIEGTALEVHLTDFPPPTYNGQGYLDVKEDGQIVVVGDWRGQAQQLIDAVPKRLTAWDGTQDVIVKYNPFENKTYITAPNAYELADLKAMGGDWLADGFETNPNPLPDFDFEDFEIYVQGGDPNFYNFWSIPDYYTDPTVLKETRVLLITEPNDIFEGTQAMRWEYNLSSPDTEPAISEVWYQFAFPVDLTGYDLMQFRIKGMPGNSKEDQLYLVVFNNGVRTDVKVWGYDGLTTDQPTDWTTVTVSIDGLGLDTVESIIFGCNTSPAPSPGDRGAGVLDIDKIIFIDDPVECTSLPVWDLNQDCTVNFGDLPEFGTYWLFTP